MSCESPRPLPQLDGAEQLCGILLHPAGHTLSPVIHSTAYHALGLYARYETFDIPPQELDERWPELQARGFRQLSVSLPHKEAVLARADVASPAALAIGAANTLTDRSGCIEADNTDWLGVLRALEPHGPWLGARATVLGAGGAARGIVYALAQLGCETRVVNRTQGRAERLANDLGCQIGTLEDPYDLLLNATPVGMHPREQESPVPSERLKPGATVFDAVYRPLETRLLREARARGCRCIDGLDMLVYQAIEQIRLWSGRLADPLELRNAAESALRSA